MALSTRLRTAGDTRSSNSLVRSKARGNVPRLEIINQTYEKLGNDIKKYTLRDRGSLLFLLGERRQEPLLAFFSSLTEKKEQGTRRVKKVKRVKEFGFRPHHSVALLSKYLN